MSGRSLTSSVVPVIPLPVLDSYLTLRVIWPQGKTSRFCGEALTIDGEFYEGILARSSPLKMFQSTAADRMDVTLANVNWEVSNLLRQAALFQARPQAFVGQVFRQAHTSGVWAHQIIFTGVIRGYTGDEAEATTSITSDIYAAGDVGAKGAIRKFCRWKYKDPKTCGYNGPLPTCSFDYEGENGCLAHANQYRFGGFVINIDRETLVIPPADPGGGGGGDDGGFGRQNPIHERYPIDAY